VSEVNTNEVEYEDVHYRTCFRGFDHRLHAKRGLRQEKRISDEHDQQSSFPLKGANMFTVVVSTPSVTLVSTWKTWQEAIDVASPHVGFARRITIKQDGAIVATIKTFSTSIQGN